MQESDLITINRIEKIGIVSGAGNSNTTNYYSFTDKAPLNGSSYYRLSQTDYNGKITIYKWVAVKRIQSGMELVVYPNPVKGDEIRFLHFDDKEAMVAYSISDMQGRKVQEGKIDLKSALTLLNLQDGLYVLSLYYTDKETVRLQFAKH